MSIVSFDPAVFKLRYPQFQSVANELLQLYFDEAALYLNNTNCSPVSNVLQRAVFLNMIVAHITQINNGPNGAGSATQGNAGRINKASEGTVSVEFDVGTQSASSSYWSQTPFGLAYWNATRAFRTFRYYPRFYRRGSRC